MPSAPVHTCVQNRAPGLWQYFGCRLKYPRLWVSRWFSSSRLSNDLRWGGVEDFVIYTGFLHSLEEYGNVWDSFEMFSKFGEIRKKCSGCFNNFHLICPSIHSATNQSCVCFFIHPPVLSILWFRQAPSKCVATLFIMYEAVFGMLNMLMLSRSKPEVKGKP